MTVLAPGDPSQNLVTLVLPRAPQTVIIPIISVALAIPESARISTSLQHHSTLTEEAYHCLPCLYLVVCNSLSVWWPK